MTEQEAIEFCKSNPEAAAKIILMVEKLEARIKELEEKLNMNSSNSSKPPSSDNKMTKKKATQKSSEKKRGGQKGHEGKNLKRVEIPDEIVSLKSKVCGGCNRDISKVESNEIIKRQVFDLPPMNIEITEYQSHKVCCPDCEKVNQERFPSHVKGVAQYGNKLKSLVSYLNAHHMLPYERITELIEDIVNHKISTGSIYNFLSESHDNLEVFEEELKKRLLQEEVLHADETGVNVQGKNLLDRLIRYQEETLRFIDDFRVPFTNNMAERDLRMIKVKQKISGTFASFTAAEFFCRIKSFIATLKKNNLSVLHGLRNAYTLQPMKTLGW